jgi:pre-mRNA-splicing factor RBM22/SLT11
LQLPYNKPLPILESLLKEPRLKKFDDVNETIENYEKTAVDTGSIMDLMKAEEFKPKGLLPPEDPKISSLYISHMTPDIREIDIRRVFEKYGKVDSVKIMPHGQSCFVNF